MIAPLMLAIFFSVPVAASALPKVMLHLVGSLVVRGADGAVVKTPVEKVVLKSGDHVEYVISATNVGTSSAVHLLPQGRIPAGTTFVRGTALAPHAHPEFTVDGKNWSVAPTVVVKTATGTETRKADPSQYTAVRFVTETPLQIHGTNTYRYEVAVK